jgi:hypothetical protein
MRSSASYSGKDTTGSPQASASFSTHGICSLSASGMGWRCALYSGYILWRNVGPGRSRTIAMCETSRVSATRISAWANPYTAVVGNPLGARMSVRKSA